MSLGEKVCVINRAPKIRGKAKQLITQLVKENATLITKDGNPLVVDSGSNLFDCMYTESADNIRLNCEGILSCDICLILADDVLPVKIAGKIDQIIKELEKPVHTIIGTKINRVFLPYGVRPSMTDYLFICDRAQIYPHVYQKHPFPWGISDQF